LAETSPPRKHGLGDELNKPGRGSVLRRSLLLGLVPALIAGLTVLASPLPAGAVSAPPPAPLPPPPTTTYVVNTAKSEIDVTVKLTIENTTPPSVTSCGYLCTHTTNYYSNVTFVEVDLHAGAVRATSNAGGVKQNLFRTDAIGRVLKLTYPAVWYGQTRVVTVTYAIPAAPHAPGGFRALKAYASLCAYQNSADSTLFLGVVSVVVPDGYLVTFTAGEPMSKPGSTDGLGLRGAETTNQVPF
jgi:hypothetical protein